MLRRLLLVFSLAFLLVSGQQAVAMHTLSHLADEQNQSQQEKYPHHAGFCDKCAAYAALDNVASASHTLPCKLAIERVVFIDSDSCSALSHPNHYCARAPPSSLNA